MRTAKPGSFPKEQTLLHWSFVSARTGKCWGNYYEINPLQLPFGFGEKKVSAYPTGEGKGSLLTCPCQDLYWCSRRGRKRRGFGEVTAPRSVQVLTRVGTQEVSASPAAPCAPLCLHPNPTGSTKAERMGGVQRVFPWFDSSFTAINWQ